MWRAFARYSNAYTLLLLLAALGTILALDEFGIISRDTAFNVTMICIAIFMFFVLFILNSAPFMSFKQRVKEEYGDPQ